MVMVLRSFLTNPSFHSLAHEHKIKIFMVVCHILLPVLLAIPSASFTYSCFYIWFYNLYALVLPFLFGTSSLVWKIWCLLCLLILSACVASDRAIAQFFNLVEANPDLDLPATTLGALFSSSPGFLPLPRLLRWKHTWLTTLRLFSRQKAFSSLSLPGSDFPHDLSFLLWNFDVKGLWAGLSWEKNNIKSC